MDSLDDFLAEGADEPVVMLNLMRFVPGGGGERFLRYLEVARPLVKRHGGEFLYAGHAAPPVSGSAEQAWDGVVMVRYSRRRDFAELMRDPDYEAASRMRLELVSEAVIQPLEP